MALGNREGMGLNVGCGSTVFCWMNLVRLNSRGNKFEVPCAGMGDSVSPFPAPGLFSTHCLLCRKSISTTRGSANMDFLKKALAMDGGQTMEQDGLVNVQHIPHDSYKHELLWTGKNLHPSSVKEDGRSTGFKQEFDNIPEEVKTYMKDMEIQIRLLCGENHEFKRGIHHLYTLVQATLTEFRGSNNKINEKFDSLAEVLDKGCPCSVNMDAKITVVHSSVKILEAKIDSMRAEIRRSTQGLQKDFGGSIGGHAENQVVIPHQ